MKAFKLLAVVGLAVALVTVPALAAEKVVTVTCKDNKIDKVEPAKVEARLGDTVKWVVRNPSQGCPADLAGGQVKISFADKSPFDVREITKTVGTVGAPLPTTDVSTDPKEIKNVGNFAYTLSFVRTDGKVLDSKDGTALVVAATPTLTEWGLIALAVLLAGGMGYMLYRRPALRPAAP